MATSDRQEYYVVEQGIVNPRDDSIAWIVFDYYSALGEAMRASRKLARARVVHCSVVHTVNTQEKEKR